MRGHEPLVAMRLRGHVPAAVFVDADGTLPRSFTSGWTTPAYPGATLHAHIVIDPTDAVPLLDLRFVVGLVVHVDGADAQRVSEIGVACLEAGARRVVTAVVSAGMEPDAIVINDSDGALTWPR
jgi:hypothetical protein